MLLEVLKIILKLLPYLLSALAVLIAWLSLRQSGRIARIDNYLHYGAPEEIDLEIKYIKDKRKEAIEAEHRDFKRTKSEIENKAGTQGLLQSGPFRKAIKDAEEQRDRRIRDIESDTDLQVRKLEARKKHVSTI